MCEMRRLAECIAAEGQALPWMWDEFRDLRREGSSWDKIAIEIG